MARRITLVNRRIQQRVTKSMRTPLHVKSNQVIYKVFRPGFKK